MLNRSNFTEKVMFQQRSDRNELGTYLRKRVSRSFQQVKSPEAGVCLTCLRRRRWVWLERRGVEGGVGLSVLTKQGPSDVKIRAPHTEGESVILAEEAWQALAPCLPLTPHFVLPTPTIQLCSLGSPNTLCSFLPHSLCSQCLECFPQVPTWLFLVTHILAKIPLPQRGLPSPLCLQALSCHSVTWAYFKSAWNLTLSFLLFTGLCLPLLSRL